MNEIICEKLGETAIENDATDDLWDKLFKESNETIENNKQYDYPNGGDLWDKIFNDELSEAHSDERNPISIEVKNLENNTVVTDDVDNTAKDKAEEIENKRPTSRESEIEAKERYGGEEQQSYKDGKEVPYGTPGSTRPDLVVEDPETGKLTAIEVKNYDLSDENNVDKLCDELKRQVEDRKNNMPEGTEQIIVLDIRGQDLSQDKKDEVANKIKEKLQDVYPDIKIDFITD